MFPSPVSVLSSVPTLMDWQPGPPPCELYRLRPDLRSKQLYVPGKNVQRIITMKRAIIFGLVFVLTLGNLPAQQAPVTFQSNTTLVIIDVAVKDKAGKVIEDL